MRTWTLVAVAALTGCSGMVAESGGGGEGHKSDAGSPSDAGPQPDAYIGVTPSTDASTVQGGDDATAACVIPAAANYNQQPPDDMGCWAEATDPVLPCSSGTYPLTCGNPSTPPPELGCGAGAGGPPHNNFYCCPCGGVPDGMTDSGEVE